MNSLREECNMINVIRTRIHESLLLLLLFHTIYKIALFNFNIKKKNKILFVIKSTGYMGYGKFLKLNSADREILRKR